MGFVSPMRDEHKEVGDAVAGESQGLSEENESRLNVAVEGVNDGSGGGDVAVAHQQPPRSIIRWERFLPVGSLKVLLVENDDSTRHVVSALLRNCSYEVIATANGLQAWKILEDLRNHVDLVLTEVAMPCLSGFGLLCKIMNHKTRKNIPVIMMSSNDSTDSVFKCLSKGSVDFLVKPVRKNELKNLWQHVWRRCHSSSGSGSESGIQAQKSAKSRSDDDSDYNTGSSDEGDNGSTGLNVRDGSDNGSGTQSSWTKRAVEADSAQPVSPLDLLADAHDSTCAQVIHSKAKTVCNERAPCSTTKVCQEQNESADNDLINTHLDIGLPKNLGRQHESYATEKVSTNLTGPSVDKLAETDPKDIHNSVLGLENSNVHDKPGTNAINLIGVNAMSCDAKLVVTATEVPNCVPKTSESRDKAFDKFKEVPSVKPSLQRLRSTEEGRITVNDDRNILRHSDLSAFSRYNTSAASAQAPTGYGGSCALPLDNSLEAAKTESMYNLISNSDAVPQKQGSNGSSDNNDMGSTTKNVSTKLASLVEKAASTSTVRCIQHSAFHPVQQGTSATQQRQEKIDNVAAAAMVRQPTGTHQVQVEHHHHHYHHHHYHVHGMQQKLQPPPDNDESSVKHMAAGSPQCGLSNVFVRPKEDNVANYSINGSNSGSNHGSNGQNGTSTAAIGGAMNMESDNGNAENGMGGGSRSCNADDQNWLTQREAALNKFRQKRKERNFEKKVRYQNRKRLAEQRPRVRGQFVRGQFVRQAISENTSQETGS